MSSFMGGDDGGIMEGAALASLANRPRSRADHSNCYDKNATDKVIAELRGELQKQKATSEYNRVLGEVHRMTLQRIADEGLLPKEKMLAIKDDIKDSLPENEKRLIQG